MVEHVIIKLTKYLRVRVTATKAVYAKKVYINIIQYQYLINNYNINYIKLSNAHLDYHKITFH